MLVALISLGGYHASGGLVGSHIVLPKLGQEEPALATAPTGTPPPYGGEKRL